MIEQTGYITATKENTAWVKVSPSESCNTCKMQGGCGVLFISRWFCQASRPVKVENILDAKEGDKVRLGISEDALLKGSVAAYIYPLVLMILFGFIGELISTKINMINSELIISLLALSGLGLGFLLLKRFFFTDKNYESPVILEIIY